MMTTWHAVMTGEDGGEFGVTHRAETRRAAEDYLEEQYPESRCVQLESPADTAAREAEIYAQAQGEHGDYWNDWVNPAHELDDWDDYTDAERAEIHQTRAEAQDW